MIDQKLVDRITQEVKKQIAVINKNHPRIKPGSGIISPHDHNALENMKKQTSARIGIGKTGARLRTKDMWNFRRDQTSARDSVFEDVEKDFIDSCNLFSVSTKCADRNEHLTRPDLGRIINDEGVRLINERCIRSPKVQIYVADGLSSQAVEDNAGEMLPVLIDGLTADGLKVGTPFFMKFGRVPAMDMVTELIDAEVTCVLIGERPGLAAAGSMSAYIVYRATVGMPEARRTVVSNIHKEGTPAVEAGAYCVGLIENILKMQKSGVELQL